jgi:FMN phosphatase YigB (HAD superfamily)
MTTRLRAVTFDFWNTLMYEGPDGLVAPRVAAWAGILEEAGRPVEPWRIEVAHGRAFASYQAAWKANRQYKVAEATACMLDELGVAVPAGVTAELVAAFRTAGQASQIYPCPGVEAGLRQLRDAGIACSIVCDIGLTPSPVLRDRLAEHGLLDLFDSWAFSDEVGIYKPAPEIFLHALNRLDVQPMEAVHVGDRLRTDVAGARALGMMSVRYSGIYDDPEPGPEADLVVHDLAQLPAALLDGPRP